MTTQLLTNIRDVLLLYPGESLRRQLRFLAERNPWWNIETSFERSLPKIRQLMRYGQTAVIDATEDSAQATDAFLQACARMGRDSVAMYTEKAHDGLEVFVRVHGALYFLGPLSDEEWVSYFDRLPEKDRATPVARAIQRRLSYRINVFLTPSLPHE